MIDKQLAFVTLPRLEDEENGGVAYSYISSIVINVDGLWTSRQIIRFYLRG